MSVPPKPIRAVVATNILVSGLIAGSGANHQLISHLYQQDFSLLVSSALQREYCEVLTHPGLTSKYPQLAAENEALLSLLATDAIQISPVRRLPVDVRDPKDAHVLAATLGGKVDYLVSNDEDLLELNNHPKLAVMQIVNVGQFLEVLAGVSR